MIKLIDLQKIVDGRTVIDIPLLEINAGEIAVIQGPIDSGAEVLFRLLTGELSPTKGRVLLCGEDATHNRNVFIQKVGVLFSEDNLYNRLSVYGNLRFYSRLHRLPKSRISEVLELVGLADLANASTADLPSGLARRLALGRAILTQPQILLLSNPLAGCDPTSINLINQVIKQMADAGVTILIITQDMANVEELCDIVYLFDQGRIIDSYDPLAEQKSQQPFLIPARDADKILLVDPADILYVYAQDDRAFLQTQHGSLPTRFTLSELERRLSRSGFFRAHRSYLVNLQQVREVIPYTRNSFSLRLKDKEGTTIPLSKSSERELRDLLGY